MSSNNDFKLDFAYSVNEVKYNLKDCGYLHYWRNKRHLLGAIAASCESDEQKYKELWSYMTEEDIANEPEEVVNSLKVLIENGGPKKCYAKGLAVNHSGEAFYNSIVGGMVRRTPEYKQAEIAFQAWLKARPGVASAWKEYATKANKRDAKVYERYATELTLHLLSTNTTNTNFRKILEHNRPDRFTAGQVVELKSDYLNKRGRDPFYYIYGEVKNSPRIGTVLKKELSASNHNYGAGSREIRVLWFASGEESRIAEKCLKIGHA